VEAQRAASPEAASRKGKDEYKGKDLVEVALLGLHFVKNLKVESATPGISLHFSHLQTLPNLVDTLGTSKRGVPGRAGNPKGSPQGVLHSETKPFMSDWRL
jgi:hypothetical protein